MNRTYCSFLLGFFFCVTVLRSEGADLFLRVKNPAQVSRKSETVEVRLSDIQAGGLQTGDGGIAVVDQGKGGRLVTQVTKEHLLFQSDFAPGETRTFLVRSAKKGDNPVEPKVDGYFAHPREDYAWENDRIAFRMYGPALAAEVNNGIDVWTKRVRGLIVRKWYEADAQEGKGTYYHTDRGEGADFFAVGRTLGAGGSGIWFGDSLYQPGVFSACRMLSNGPIRTSFELMYETWNVQGKKLTEVKRISLDAGQNLNRIEVRFTGVNPRDSLLIACGLVKRKDVRVSGDERRGWLAFWGPTNNDPVNGSLGTGILLLPSLVVGKHEDSSQVMLLGRLTAGQPFVYWAGAGWTRSGDFRDATTWDKYLKEASLALTEPLQISVSPR